MRHSPTVAQRLQRGHAEAIGEPFAAILAAPPVSFEVDALLVRRFSSEVASASPHHQLSLACHMGDHTNCSNLEEPRLSDELQPVQNAVEQVLGKHGAAVPIDKLWVGFVAPENIASQENADKIAVQLGREAGATVHGSVAQLGSPAASSGAHTEALKLPGHIIGIVFQSKLVK